MTRLALVLTAFVLLLPSAATGAACSPLDCAPSQFTVAGGTLLAVRAGFDKPVHVVDLRTGRTLWQLPAGVASNGVLVSQNIDENRLTWYDVARGTELRQTSIPVAKDGYHFFLAGVSQSADRAVLASSDASTFAVVSPGRRQIVKLPSTGWRFDALRGSKLVLIKQLKRGYQIRLYDLASGRLRAQPLKDPDKSSTIWGIPFARTSSADGRYVFTLYASSEGGSMVHVLDLKDATARCIDLPGDGDFASAVSYSLVLSHDRRTLWAVSPGYGRAVAIDVRLHKIVDAFSFDRGDWISYTVGIGAVSPDGARLAISDGRHVWLVDPKTHTVQWAAAPRRELGFDFSPDGGTLWGVGAGRAARVSLTPR